MPPHDGQEPVGVLDPAVRGVGDDPQMVVVVDPGRVRELLLQDRQMDRPLPGEPGDGALGPLDPAA